MIVIKDNDIDGDCDHRDDDDDDDKDDKDDERDHDSCSIIEIVISRRQMSSNDAYIYTSLTGEFKDDNMHGHGYYRWQGGNEYEGTYSSTLLYCRDWRRLLLFCMI